MQKEIDSTRNRTEIFLSPVGIAQIAKWDMSSNCDGVVEAPEGPATLLE